MSVCVCKSYIEILDGLSHVELVYGVDNDGGSREEGEQDEEAEVEHHIACKPLKTPHWEIFPVGRGNSHNRTVCLWTLAIKHNINTLLLLFLKELNVCIYVGIFFMIFSTGMLQVSPKYRYLVYPLWPASVAVLFSLQTPHCEFLAPYASEN